MIFQFDYVPIAKQLLEVFEAVSEELRECASGKMILEIENNVILRFGLVDVAGFRQGVKLPDAMSDEQMDMLRHVLEEALSRKRYWRQGELEMSFAVKGKEIQARVRCESGYTASELFGNGEND